MAGGITTVLPASMFTRGMIKLIQQMTTIKLTQLSIGNISNTLTIKTFMNSG